MHTDVFSDALLLVPFIMSAYYWWKGNNKLGAKILTLTLFSGALGVILKLVFRVKRTTGFDPFALPSTHAAISWPLFFAVPNVWTAGYALLLSCLRVVEGFHTWSQVFAGFITALLAWLIYRELEKREKQFAERKMFHMGIALIVGYISLFLSLKWQIAFTGVVLVGSLVVYAFRGSRLLGGLYKHYSKPGVDMGPVTLALGMFLGALVGLAPVVGFTLGLVDGLSGLLGRLRRTEGKTLTGLVGGYIGGLATFLLLWGFYPIVFLAAVGVVSPLVEYVSRSERVDDNVIISLVIIGLFFLSSSLFV